jgi:hypothetical protein
VERLLQHPAGRGCRRFADAEGAVVKAPDKKSGESTSTAAPPKRMRQLLPVRLSSRWVGVVPADKTFAYSEADWQSIKVSLDRIGIDADVVTVLDRWWAHPDPAAALVAEPQLIDFEKKQSVMLVKRPLREQLQELAADSRGLAAYRKQGDSLTPRQEAAEIQEILNKLEAARAALNSRLLDFIPQKTAVGPEPQTAVAREALTVIIDKAKRHVDKLTAEGSRSSVNARKVHIEYWDALVLLWQAITADQNRRPRERGLNSFLLACSKSVFPDETSKSNIKNFRQNVRRKGVNDRRKSGVVVPL